MRLIKIIDTKCEDLITCNLCGDRNPLTIASHFGWVEDIDEGHDNDLDTNTYYCSDCKSFLINKVDSTNEV